MILFFDTSALVKFYQEEEGTELVTELVLERSSNLMISELASLEFISALMRRYRNGEIDQGSLDEVISGFNADLQRFTVKYLNERVLRKAEIILREVGGMMFLRTLDALQLAAFQLIESKETCFVTSDSRLEKAAIKLGAKTINPVQ